MKFIPKTITLSLIITITLLLTIFNTGRVHGDCYSDVLRIVTNTSDPYPSRSYMIDFTGKALDDLGNFDECMDLGNAISTYCLLEAFTETTITAIPVPVYLGLCLPPSCNDEALDKLIPIIQGYSETYPFLKSISWDKASFHCQYKEEKLSVPAIITICLTAFLVSLVISGTTLEEIHANREKKTLKSVVSVSGVTVQYSPLPNEDPSMKTIYTSVPDSSGNDISINTDVPKKKEKPSKFVIFLKCFAIQPNLKFLFQDNTQGGDSPLASLNGLRVCMMLWIILGHTFTYFLYPVGFDNDLELAQKYMTRTSFQVVPAAEFAVDVFFYISGFLVMFMLLKELNLKKGRISWALFYFHRYWRLTPVFAFIMLFYTTLTPHMINGPFKYQYRQSKTDLCLSNWWTNLLYINNFVPHSSGEQCMGWTWFLANDMQFYIISPIFALLFRKNRKLGWALIAACSIGCLIANWTLADHYNLVPMDPNDDKFNSILYNKPYTRIIAYLQGIAVAFLLQYDDLDIVRNRIVRYIGYAFSFGVTFTPIYLTTSFWKNGGHWPVIKNLLYITFSRVGFLLGIMLIMYAMYRRHTYLLRKVLSQYLWVPLARITYTAYLTHPILIFIQYFNTTRVFHLSPINAAGQYIANLVLAYSVGLVFHLLLEKPTANLERLILPHRGASHAEKK